MDQLESHISTKKITSGRMLGIVLFASQNLVDYVIGWLASSKW